MTEISVGSLATLTSNILRQTALYVPSLELTIRTINIFFSPTGGVIKVMISWVSGSMVTYGVLKTDTVKTPRKKKGRLAIRGIKAAMERDAFSGNGIRVATITKEEGFIKLPDEEVGRKIKEIN